MATSHTTFGTGFSLPKPMAVPKFVRLRSSFFEFPLASKIMVRNLSYSTDEKCLKKEFSNFGQIAEVKLVSDGETKRSKGYAFIQYTRQDDAMQALESMDKKYFDGRVIFVEFAKPGKHIYDRYPKTSGPPEEQSLTAQNEAD